MKYAVCVPYHDPQQFEKWMEAWGLLFASNVNSSLPEWLFACHDMEKEGCAKTKNKTIRSAVKSGAEYIVVLDDDCFPTEPVIYERNQLKAFVQLHIDSLNPQSAKQYKLICKPRSRGTPYSGMTVERPVVASIGFWAINPDLDAVTQLSYGLAPLRPKCRRNAIYGQFFPFSGMNFAFRAEHAEWFQLIEGVGRFDDIYMGYLAQKLAYEAGYCFNLGGPWVNHIRQSNVWANLKVEAQEMERNEQLWKDIALAPSGLSYTELRKHVGL
jgi:hypothetical protein